eukprot:5528286-Pyramimonas_sp.AAC.1
MARGGPGPMGGAVGVMAIWKWYYYAPNTLKQLYDSQIKRGECHRRADSSRFHDGVGDFTVKG